ncbi:hypothetical protein IPZ58_35340 [Streptomyces roseoverticillatus]|uniref:hypothetical protein n=1 Tax=Streptomyces roseoverticillatus TaxID=66429 RepID=UPI001F362D18|nr:hypothetical protein [Streptomyces roseoverticillatus]MCF3106801.1 hypothetical protein [Streptomyces roseoverticillatus]
MAVDHAFLHLLSSEDRTWSVAQDALTGFVHENLVNKATSTQGLVMDCYDKPTSGLMVFHRL